MKVGPLALPEDDQGEAVAEDPEDPDPDEKDALDPELCRLEDGMVDGEVLVAGVLLAVVEVHERYVVIVGRGGSLEIKLRL